jgi:hypothetical protein
LLGNRYSCLNPESDQHAHLKPFLAHFPALDYLMVTISDDRDLSESNYDTRHDITPDNLGSFALFIARLEPLASSLTILVMWIGHKNDEYSSRWTNFVLPCDGFAHFKSLRHLAVPYQCLFGPVDPQWSHITPSPTDLIPSTLGFLSLGHVRVRVLDWLERLSYCRDDFPVLKDVQLCCDSHGDAYNELMFESHPHPAFSGLCSVDMKLQVSNMNAWKKEWDDYDLKTLDFLPWLRSFGSACTGATSEIPTTQNFILAPHRHQPQLGPSKQAAAEPDEDLRKTDWCYYLIRTATAPVNVDNTAKVVW